MGKTYPLLDEKKISFIMCCNNSQYQKECLSYLAELEIPEGYEIEFFPIINAKSMAAGYNQGMHLSNAKFKVYLHQDVMIWNRHFIYDMLNIFSNNNNIGMLGVLGGVDLPDNGLVYLSWNVGSTYICNNEDASILNNTSPSNTFKEVEAIDGMLIATQYDLIWREDLFHNWIFYDIAQAFEFRKQGYSVVIPHQKTPWCMHDCGKAVLPNCDEERQILLHEYSSFFKKPTKQKVVLSYRHDLKILYQQLTDSIIWCMEQGELQLANETCEFYDEKEILDNDLSLLKKLVTICNIEQQLYGKPRTWNTGESYKIVKERFTKVKFMLWDAERDRNNGKARFIKILYQNIYSIPFLVFVGIHNTYSFIEILPLLSILTKEIGTLEEQEYLAQINKQLFIRSCEKSPIDANYKTPEEVSAIAQEFRENAEKQAKELPEYRDRINHYLKKKDYNSLHYLLSEDNFRNNFRFISDTAYIILAEQIYQEEIAENWNKTIFDGHNTMAEVILFIQEIKFAIWRLEFNIDKQAGIHFINFIHEHQISPHLLKYIIHVAGMDKIQLLENLVMLFLEQNMIGMAFTMLKYANELQPGSEEILCTMAQLCIQLGKRDEAIYLLNQIKWPTKITENLRKACKL